MTTKQLWGQLMIGRAGTAVVVFVAAQLVRVRIAIATLIAPKQCVVAQRAAVEALGRAGLEIAARIETSGHFNNPGNPTRRKAARDIGRRAYVIGYWAAELLGWLEQPKRRAT